MNKGLHAGFSPSGLPQQVNELLYSKTLVANGTFDTAEVWGQGLPLIYDSFVIEGSLRSAIAGTADNSIITLNGDTTDANYTAQTVNGNGGSPTAGSADTRYYSICDGNTATADMYSVSKGILYNVSNTDLFTTYIVEASAYQTGNTFSQLNTGRWKNKTPVVRIQLAPPSNLFVARSRLDIYGQRLVYPLA